jgi:hypothetical protein
MGRMRPAYLRAFLLSCNEHRLRAQMHSVCVCVCVCVCVVNLPFFFLSSPLTGHMCSACLRAYLLFRNELRLNSQMYSV